MPYVMSSFGFRSRESSKINIIFYITSLGMEWNGTRSWSGTNAEKRITGNSDMIRDSAGECITLHLITV